MLSPDQLRTVAVSSMPARHQASFTTT